jgi:hypothetical protein
MKKYDLPHIRSVEDCEREFSKPIIISDYNTYEKFDELYYRIYNSICACFDIPGCASYPVPFKFYDDDQKTYYLPMTKFLLNLNAWRPLIELYSLEKYYNHKIEVLDESFIIGQMMSNRLRVGLETKVLKILNDYGIAFDRTSELIKTVIERYQEISLEFALLTKGSVFTLENCFLDDYRRSEKIRELNNTVIPQNIQTADVEEILRDKYRELVDELAASKNPIWYVSKAGNHIKEKQVQELFISYGQLPDVSGNVIPYTMEGNGFNQGIVDPISYYIAATGARLSAIMNTEEMGNAGYLTRNIILLSRTMTLSPTMYDCGTKHMLKLKVKDSTFLHRLENRWYSEYEDGPLELIHYETHRHLIGKEIYIRSLVTCAGGDEVCHVCYGKDSHLVMNMPGMAIYNTEVYSEPVSQNILSTKHLLFTAANRLVFSPSFEKYFRFNAGDVYIIDKDEWDNTILFEDLSIRIMEDNIRPVNEQDMMEYNTFGNSVDSPFYVYNNKTGEYDKIEIVNYEGMFIDAPTIKLFKLVRDRKRGYSYYDVPFEVLSEEMEGRLLSIDIKNNGLTDNLYAIMNLLEKESAKFNTYDELAQYFFEMLINANIKCRNIQGEIILNRLVRDANNIFERPDFTKLKEPEYKILTLNQALINTKAPVIGLSYQEIKRQLLSDDIYTIKDGKAYLDPLYASEISTERFKKLHEEIQKRKKARENDGGNKSKS